MAGPALRTTSNPEEQSQRGTDFERHRSIVVLGEDARSLRRGFTIDELLIVLVVIAILAAITIVSYNGISNRAKSSAASSAAAQAVKKVMAYATLNADQYPATLSDAGVIYQHGYVEEHRAALATVADALTQVQGASIRSNTIGHGDSNGRQGRPFKSSDNIVPSVRQAIQTNEKRHLTEVEMASFLGGSGGARTHDFLLKSLLPRTLALLPTPVVRELQERTRHQFLGALAVKMDVNSDRIDELLTTQRLVRGALTHQLQARSFPLNLLPSSPRKEAV